MFDFQNRFLLGIKKTSFGFKSYELLVWAAYLAFTVIKDSNLLPSRSEQHEVLPFGNI